MLSYMNQGHASGVYILKEVFVQMFDFVLNKLTSCMICLFWRIGSESKGKSSKKLQSRRELVLNVSNELFGNIRIISLL